MSDSKTGDKALVALERQRRALELRKAGLGYQAIAARLGYASHSGAIKAVQTAMRRTLQEPADELRALELARLDDLLRGIWVAARTGNVQKIDRVLRIMQRRASLLGLDAPKKFADATDQRRRRALHTKECIRAEEVCGRDRPAPGGRGHRRRARPGRRPRRGGADRAGPAP